MPWLDIRGKAYKCPNGQTFKSHIKIMDMVMDGCKWIIYLDMVYKDGNEVVGSCYHRLSWNFLSRETLLR